MTLARALLLFSVASFAVVGLAYLLVPGTMLSVVGIPSSATSDFLMRTEGVALLSGAVFIWAGRDVSSTAARLVLLGLALYFILGSAVDLAAFVQGIVGSAAVPSVVVRTAIGMLCLASVAVMGRPQSSASETGR
jgi:hypothetical protein